MGALHELERTHQVAPHADVALNHMRGVLSKLQTQHANHPAANQALEAVASSLSLVHVLSRMAGAPSVSPTGAAPQNVARDPFAAPAGTPKQGAQGTPAAQASGVPQVASQGQASPSMPVPSPPAGDLQVIGADLGAHSATNFYKGLSGNDIIDHGGLFVSTYVFPKMNAAVRLRVSLPGGYEFEANAVVKWTRADGGADAPPGFGAQFTAITNEARQLIYRYVRNREPIFHDDF